MNLTDLTAELETQASNAAPAASMQRLTGVRQRIRARRRKQVASAAGLTALGVAAVILIPGMSQLRADRVPTPPATAGPIQPSDPLTFASDVAGDPLIAHGVSTPGAGELVVRFTPNTTLLATSFYCRIPGVTGSLADRGPFQFEATINGHRYSIKNDCSEDRGANESTISYGDVDSKENRDSWAKLGVKPGQESVLRMTVTAKGNAAVPPTTRLGVGIYALTGERVMDGGVPIKVQAKIDGHQYRLADHTTAPATAKRHRLSLNVPAGQYPVAVLYGNPGDTSDYDLSQSISLAVDGKDYSSSGSGGITSSDGLLDDAKAHTLELRLDSKLRGTMVLAYYVRVD
jgi:hypothetical protein